MKSIKLLLFVSIVIVMTGIVKAADDGVIRINFQEAGNPKPLRTGIVHLEDTGLTYGDRGNGYDYGWSSDNTSDARRRYDIGDCRLDGNIRLGSDDWEIELDNGNYLVNIAMGDAKYEVDNSFKIEGASYTDPDGDDFFDIYEDIAVTLSDGKLTIENNSADPRICYIEIVDAAIGFPPKETFPAVDPTQLAFPTAEGFAKNLTGGRGGDVYHVTNLDWSGPGSLAWGFGSTYESYPRTIVFDVSGHIGCSHPESIYGDINGCYGADGDMDFNGNNITVAGQTAPGKGITIRDHTVKINGSSNIIMRYFRMRLGDENKGAVAGPDGFTSEDNDGLFLDHISMSWSIDGMWDSRRCGNMSVQWCIFAEPLDDSLHEKGRHGYLMSFRNLDDDITLHHNLFSSGTNRHPTLASNEYEDYDHLADFRNNVNYNWTRDMRSGSCNQNIVNNTFRFGPSGFGTGTMIAVVNRMPDPWGYLTGNVWESIDSGDATDCANFTADNYLACRYTEEPTPATRSEYEAFTEFTVPGYVPPVTESPSVSFQNVVDYAGCSLVRDTVDVRQLNNVVNSTGSVIDSQDDVGGWDDYPSESRPAGFDTDLDGMPNEWETARGLDPDDPDDRNDDDDSDGYTNLEEYLNELVEENVPGPPEPDDPIKINFQLDSAIVPSGYLKDDGAVYADRGNWYSYGWSSDLTDEDRDRNRHDDQRYDTLVHLKAVWEIELLNGKYDIDLVAGDAKYDDQINDILLEGVLLVDLDGYGGGDYFDEYNSVVVAVSDGKLTIEEGPESEKPKLCFIHIRPYKPVNLVDFAKLSGHWLSGCTESSNWCDGMDYDHKDGVNFKDLQEFVSRWLD